MQVSLKSEVVALPVFDTSVVAATNRQSESVWVAAPVHGGVSNSQETLDHSSTFLPLPETPKPIYFTARELHLHPSPIGTILKEEAGRIYPDSSTHLLIQINEQGRVDHAEVLSSTNETLAREALQAFASARYVPGAIAGKRVKSELRVEVISSSDLGMLLRPAN